MIYEIKMPDLSGLEPDDEIELLGKTHAPVKADPGDDRCFNCSLCDNCPTHGVFFCASLSDEYIFKLK